MNKNICAIITCYARWLKQTSKEIGMECKADSHNEARGEPKWLRASSWGALRVSGDDDAQKIPFYLTWPYFTIHVPSIRSPCQEWRHDLE